MGFGDQWNEFCNILEEAWNAVKDQGPTLLRALLSWRILVLAGGIAVTAYLYLGNRWRDYGMYGYILMATTLGIAVYGAVLIRNRYVALEE